MKGFSEEDLKKKGFKADKFGNWRKGSIAVLVPDKKPTENKKIKGAKKVEFEGVVYDSTLELYMRKLLWKHNIPHDFKVSFLLQDKFRYMGEAIRVIEWTPDFIPFGTIIVDTKGHKTDIFKLRLKLFKKWCVDNGKEYQLEFPRNQKQCEALVIKLIGMK
jgi:hypothetical protein